MKNDFFFLWRCIHFLPSKLEAAIWRGAGKRGEREYKVIKVGEEFHLQFLLAVKTEHRWRHDGHFFHTPLFLVLYEFFSPLLFLFPSPPLQHSVLLPLFITFTCHFRLSSFVSVRQHLQLWPASEWGAGEGGQALRWSMCWAHSGTVLNLGQFFWLAFHQVEESQLHVLNVKTVTSMV